MWHNCRISWVCHHRKIYGNFRSGQNGISKEKAGNNKITKWNNQRVKNHRCQTWWEYFTKVYTRKKKVKVVTPHWTPSSISSQTQLSNHFPQQISVWNKYSKPIPYHIMSVIRKAVKRSPPLANTPSKVWKELFSKGEMSDHELLTAVANMDPPTSN